MKNFSFSILFVFLLVAAPRVQAQLDQTPADWEAHCGKPVQEFDNPTKAGGKIRVYRMAGLEITATFVRERAGSISYEKVSKADFTANEIDRLLQANQGNSTWRPAPLDASGQGDKPMKAWNRADGGFGVYSYSDYAKARTLTVSTKWYGDSN